MTAKRTDCIATLISAGISADDARALRRIEAEIIRARIKELQRMLAALQASFRIIELDLSTITARTSTQ